MPSGFAGIAFEKTLNAIGHNNQGFSSIYNRVYLGEYRRVFGRLRGCKDMEAVAGRLLSSYVRMPVRIQPKILVSSFMGYLKRKSSLKVFDKGASLKRGFDNRMF